MAGWIEEQVDGKINRCVNELKVTAQIKVSTDSWIHRTLKKCE